MKEQDAAHSFEKEFFEIQFVERAHKLRENLNLVDAMRHLYNEFVAPVDDELTRLRSELQQECELRKELVGYVVAYHSLASLTSDEDIYIRSLIEKAKL